MNACTIILYSGQILLYLLSTLYILGRGCCKIGAPNGGRNSHFGRYRNSDYTLLY
jgi:hypothetical protein